MDSSTRQVNTVLQVTVQEQITPASGTALGTILNVALSTDGTNYGYVGSFTPDRVTQDGTHTYYVTTLNIPDVLVYAASQTYYVKVWSATSTSDPGISAAVSASCSVPTYSLPAATLITTLTIPAAPYGGSFPYSAISPDGVQYFDVGSIAYNDSACVADADAFFVRITAQSLDSSKVAITAQQAYGGQQVVGGSVSCDDLMGPYGPDPTNPTGNNIAYVRFRCYVCNRLDQTTASFLNAACATLQTGLGSGAGYIDVLVASGGAIPGPGIPAQRINPTTINAPLGKDGSGNLNLTYNTPLTVLSNAITIANSAITQTYLASASVGATQMAANAITASNGALAALAVLDSNVSAVHIGKVISGTVIFSGDVYIARGFGFPLIQLGFSGINLWSAATTSGSSQAETASASGLTSSPYVSLTSSQIGLFSGGNQSMTLTSTSLNLWSVNGNSSFPYLNLTSSGVTIQSGNFTTQISSSQVTMSYSLGAQMTLNSSGLTITNNCQFNVNSGQIQLWSVANNSSFPCVGLTSSQLNFTAGSYSTTVSSSQIQMTGTASTLTLNSSGLTIASGSYSLTASSSSLTLAYSGGSQVQITSSSATIQYNSSNYVQVGSGSISITSSGLSTSISGNSVTTGAVTCASLSLFVGTIAFTNGVTSTSYSSAASKYLQVSVGGVTYLLQLLNP
ncbi:MAG TPA: hypothetical protein VN736_01230 [Candidatus Limnocylindrales bacterium]|nr:hypothetical protein [Candidatus Limnocylindrales bacterium]